MRINIGTSGELKIEFTAAGFELENTVQIFDNNA